MYICQICLRTDRKLKLIDTRLADFHDELCEYALACTLNPQYCTICEHLLRKAYNFKARCRAANKILKNYKKLKTAKEDLYTLVPPTTLGTWEENTAYVYNYTYDDKPQPMLTIKGEQSLSIPKLNIKSEHPTNEVLLSISASNDNVRETNDPLMEEYEMKIEAVDNLEEKIEIRHIQTNLKESPKIEKVLNLEENRKTECVNTIKLDMLRKFKNNTHIDSNLDNTENNTKTDSKLIYLEELLNTEDIPDESSLNTADDCDSDDFILNDNIFNRRKKIKEIKTVTKKKTETKTADSIKKQKELTNKSLLELTNISISDEESVSDDSNKQSKVKTSTTKKSVIKNVDQRKVTKKKKTKRKQMNLKEMQDYAVETVRKFCAKISNKRPKEYCNKWLKATLKSKFESCGELKAEDGTVINKQCILNIIEEREPSRDVKKLWRIVRSSNFVLNPTALSLFKLIQHKDEIDKKYTSVFDIQYLNSEEKVVEEFLKRKTVESYVNAEFKCDVCHLWFKYKKSLEYHMKFHDVKAGNFVCTICKIRQRTKDSITRHMLMHKEVFKCKLCPLVTHYRRSMINHYDQHKGVEYKCEPCGLKYKSQSAYNTHMAKCCTQPKNLVCTRCARTFSGKIGLRLHMSSKHRDAPPIDPTASETCSQCDVTFVTREVYEKHLKISHTLKITDPTRKLNKRKPSGVTTRKIPIFTCRVCNAKGPSNGWLVLHFDLQHPSVDMSALYIDKKKHLCDTCGKGYSVKYALRDHMNTHTGARPYACDQCPARFASRICLMKHRQIHGLPQYPCLTCGKQFRSKGNLYTHMRSHIGDRRFKCPVCGKGFLHRASVREHVRGVHDNVKRVKKRPLDRGIRGCKEEDDSY